MRAAALRTLPARAPRAQEQQELCVVFSCEELVCALPTRWVERLVLPSDVTVIAGDRAQPEASGETWRLAQVNQRLYAACDLATQLGLEQVGAAWALLRVPHGDRVLPIALQIGPCLVVQPLGRGLPLPAGVFRARSGAVAAAFPTTLLESKVKLTDVGLRLDPENLWTEPELEDAVALLSDKRE